MLESAGSRDLPRRNHRSGLEGGAGARCEIVPAGRSARTVPSHRRRRLPAAAPGPLRTLAPVVRTRWHRRRAGPNVGRETFSETRSGFDVEAPRRHPSPRSEVARGGSCHLRPRRRADRRGLGRFADRRCHGHGATDPQRADHAADLHRAWSARESPSAAGGPAGAVHGAQPVRLDPRRSMAERRRHGRGTARTRACLVVVEADGGATAPPVSPRALLRMRHPALRPPRPA